MAFISPWIVRNSCNNPKNVKRNKIESCLSKTQLNTIVYIIDVFIGFSQCDKESQLRPWLECNRENYHPSYVYTLGLRVLYNLYKIHTKRNCHSDWMLPHIIHRITKVYFYLLVFSYLFRYRCYPVVSESMWVNSELIYLGL